MIEHFGDQTICKDAISGNNALTSSQKTGLKKMRALLALVMLGILTCNHAVAAERRLLQEISVDEISTDTQVAFKNAGDSHLAFMWWVPNEFWISIFARDTNTPEADKQAMLKLMSEISLIAVVQADISNLGGFHYYTKQDVEKNMLISFADSGNIRKRLVPVQTISPDLEVVLSVFKPVLTAAMGNLGSNLHFYVLNDKSNASSRLIDPYRQGVIEVQLSRKDDVLIKSSIELPLNALFIPRICPNGKEAHISWKYCPWSGKRLEN